MTRVVALATALAAVACVSPASVFTCDTSDQCTVGGTCQPNGYCSFPDPSCPSGQRYGDAAGGGNAGRCVGDELPPDARDQPDSPPGTPDGRPDATPEFDASNCTAPFAPDAFGCHAFFTSMSTGYDAARAYCQSIGGDLPVIETVAEGTFIATAMLVPASTERAWMGLDFRTGTWTWVNGSGLTLTNWNTGEPSVGDNVAVIRPDGTWAGRLDTDPWFVDCEK